MMEVPESIKRAARRLVKSGDFADVMLHLANEQAVVVLNVDVNNKDHLQLARIYYDAISIVPDLVNNLLMETEQDNG